MNNFRLGIFGTRRAVFILALVASLVVVLPSAFAAVNRLLWRAQSPLGTLGALALRGDLDSEGNYYYGGASADVTDVTEGSFGAAFIRKQGPGGDVLWTKEFGAGDLSVIFDIAVDKRRDWIYVVGLVSGKLPNQHHSGGSDAVLRKYRSDGVIYWTRQFGSGGDDGAAGVAVGPGGNVVVTGAVETGLARNLRGFGDHNGFVRTYNAGGKLLRARQFGTSATDIGTAVAVDRRGQVFVAGATSGRFRGQRKAGEEDSFLLKINSSGQLGWVQQFGRASVDFATDVVIEPRGNIYVVGASGPRAFVHKYTPGGATLWTRLWGNHLALGATVDAERNLYVVGAKNIENSELPDELPDELAAFTRKYANTGTKLWTRNVAKGAATGAAATPAGELVVSGITTNGPGQLFADAPAGEPDEPLTKVFVVKFAAE